MHWRLLGDSRSRPVALSQPQRDSACLIQWNESSPQLVGTVTLNPLRQVSAAEFKVTGGNARITVTVTDVNPVKVALDGVSGAKTFSRTFSVPGPITFTRLKMATSL